MATLALVLWTVVVVGLTYITTRCSAALCRYHKRRAAVLRFPGVKPRNILLGHLLEFPGTNEEAFRWGVKNLREFPRLGYICYGPYPAVWVAHPDTVKSILKTSEPKPMDVGPYSFAKPWLGEGLLLTGGKRWARNRRLLTPAFHFDILKPYTKVNNAACDILLDKINLSAERGEYFDVHQNISLCTLDIILRCAFSYESDCQQQGSEHPYAEAVSFLTNCLVYRGLRPWLFPDIFFYLSPSGRKFRKSCKLVHSIADKIIQSRRQTLSEGGADLNGRGYSDFLDILLTSRDEGGNGLSDREIRCEVDTFMFAGHDTTASGISWALYSLAEHKKHQRLCQDEIDEILQHRCDDSILWDDLSKFQHLTLCIKESLRLHTPVPLIQRSTTSDMYIDGHFLPKGTVVDIQLYLLMHNPSLWEKPFDFIPERFQADKITDSFQFLPFSAGPRNCIGQNFAMHEMKVVIARILHRFDLELKPDHYVGHEMKTVMKTENGMYIKFTPRSTSRS